MKRTDIETIVNEFKNQSKQDETTSEIEGIEIITMDGKKTIANRHFDLSDNFFDLVEAVLQETIKQGNNTQGFLSSKDDLSIIKKKYKDWTKWSDSRIIIPILFNFFHGIELFLKGSKHLLNQPVRVTHNLSYLYREFKTNYSDKTVLIKIFDYYIFPDCKCNILYKFYKENNLTDSSKFYEFFKYPYNNKFTLGLNYKDLRNNEKQGLDFFKQIITDIETIRAEKILL
jgi:hypothetical protein